MFLKKEILQFTNNTFLNDIDLGEFSFDNRLTMFKYISLRGQVKSLTNWYGVET
ncbi:MAG: hypothetical protein CM15mP65_26480 [Crocinitomicaceae bacterium]|nr:MAG: hypothetical protein CM15mP65_26480 [Crocinitomicaceae bacterium]